VGIDIQPIFKYAAEKAAESGLKNLEFVQGSTTVLADQSFDVVISHDSFEHFAEPIQMLAEMIRLTRVGGTLLIKFGPPWRSPWGRHLSGTIRKDRPWIHLVVPERVVMHCHSIYHNEPLRRSKYAELPGGLNKMTISRFLRLVESRRELTIEALRVSPIFSALRPLSRIPQVQEFFSSGIMVRCHRSGDPRETAKIAP
jgi:SAM-dependent methyltransferase